MCSRIRNSTTTTTTKGKNKNRIRVKIKVKTPSRKFVPKKWFKILNIEYYVYIIAIVAVGGVMIGLKNLR